MGGGEGEEPEKAERIHPLLPLLAVALEGTLQKSGVMSCVPMLRDQIKGHNTPILNLLNLELPLVTANKLFLFFF